LAESITIAASLYSAEGAGGSSRIAPPPQVETFNPNVARNQGFNPRFSGTQVIPPETMTQEPEFQPNPGMNRDELAMNSPTDSPLPSGLTSGQQLGSSEDLLDTQQAFNPNLRIPGEETTQTQETEPNASAETELVAGLRPEVWEYQQQLQQEARARRAAETQGEVQPPVQEASTQPQQQALAETNPPQSNPQAPTTTPSNPESNTESEPELVSGLRPEVWARQQELRQQFLARQAAANQGESQSQETVTRQQPASAAPQQTTTEPNSQSVSEVTEPEVQQPAVAETPKPEAELSYHQKQMLAYHQELVEQNRLQAQGGSLSEEQEAMLAGAEEFYTWFMQLRQDWPDLTTKTPSSIADNYPLAACPEKLAGRAVVGTVVNPNGEILESPKVLRGSGSEILDNEALNYVESVQFPTHEQPTAYQYSFEFNYDREACAIAQPDDSSQSPHNHSEAMTEDSQTIEGEAGEGINSPAAIEAMEDSGQPKPTEFPHSDDNQSETEAFTPQVQSSQPIVEGEAGEGINSPAAIEAMEDSGQPKPTEFPHSDDNQSETEAFTPQVQSSPTEAEASSAPSQDDLQTEPLGSDRGYHIIAPVPVPTTEDR
jgi:TonB family protein